MYRLEQAERLAELYRRGYPRVAGELAWACGEIRRLTQVSQEAGDAWGACLARAKELETALGYIALEDEGEEYDLPDWDIIQQFPREFRAPAIARVVLAGGQEKDKTRANQGG